MEADRLDFLRSLIQTPSPSGFEERVQELFIRRVKEQTDRQYKDVHGNAFGVIHPTAKVRVMLAGHCDEVGLMVQHVNEQGFIYFSAVGGIDAHITPGKRVHIHTRDGVVPGVIGKKPIHLIEEKERLKVSRIREQWIDIGGKDREEVLSTVRIGDPITFDTGFDSLLGSRVAGRGFDDRVGAFVVAEVLREVNRKHLKVALFGVSTVQEEIGLRGARTSSFGVDPHLGIAIDVTFASDCPDVDKRRTGDIALGEGPVLARGPNVNPRFFEALVDIAEKNSIPYQVQAEARATGTDANAMQISRSGVVTALIGIPDRYMHTPSEVVDLEDLDNAISLLTKAVEWLKEGMSWIP